MTRLPTGMPTRPVFQAGISWPSVNTFGGTDGCVADGQLLLNALPVRQIEPTYLTTIDCLAWIGAPEPLISVLTTSLLGGVFLGTEICGAPPGPADTVGSLPPPLLRCLPDALAFGWKECSTSMTQTRVSAGLTPICELPCGP